MTNSLWNDDTEAMLVKYHKDGMSASKIADRISAAVRISVSRNAVIGKLHRLGLMGEKTPRKPRRTGIAKPTQQLELHPGAIARRVNVLRSLHTQMEEALGPVIPPSGIGIADLEPWMCRFPSGDPGKPGFCYCAKPKQAGFSYCEFHVARAYQNPPVRRPKRALAA